MMWLLWLFGFLCQSHFDALDGSVDSHARSTRGCCAEEGVLVFFFFFCHPCLGERVSKDAALRRGSRLPDVCSRCFEDM